MAPRKTANKVPAKRVRDTAAERRSAKNSLALRVGDVAAAQRDGSLGEEYIKLAQAMILCTLPLSEQSDRQITRKARLGDGSWLTVTFTAAVPGVPIPFGADRKLLAWMLDRAIRLNSPYIPWESASEYRREMGLSIGGSGNKQLTHRFERLAGLVINIQRRAESEKQGTTYPIIEKSYLPTSITGKTIEAAGQQTLPELRDRFGFVLNQTLFDDIRKHNLALPRQIWRDLRGSTQVLDIVFWLLFRCYAAKTATVIPWDALSQQFSTDSNPWRVRSHAREAIKIVGTMWPDVRLGEVDVGIQVDYAPTPMLIDDLSKGRVRRLSTSD